MDEGACMTHDSIEFSNDFNRVPSGLKLFV